MLFNSYTFIFLFVPLCLLGFFILGNRLHHRVACAWLVGMSLVFYGWQSPEFLWPLVLSMLGNYSLGLMLSSGQSRHLKAWLIAGISANLLGLMYYKYTAFLLINWNLLTQTQLAIPQIVLPLGISFFTFQQIAYLVDAYRGETREYNFLHYSLFVCFFPQLVAGPIVHHRQILPQFAREAPYRWSARNLAVGLSLFAMGLFKKTVLADGVAPLANHAFGSTGQDLNSWLTLLGLLAYSMQLYFDFSGYSDMAIGLARLFGIQLPANFHSPYRAQNIIDFWRRWHITLSHFLRDYLYIPLGGSRYGAFRRYLNLLATMLLGGLWHGAGWNFLIWGLLHGLYLCINHGVRALCPESLRRQAIWRAASWLATFSAVMLAWVFFRATSLDQALDFLGRLFGNTGQSGFSQLPTSLHGSLYLLLAACIIAWLLPNSRQWFHRYRPGLQTQQDLPLRLARYWQPWAFRINTRWLCLSALLLCSGILALAQVSEFLYFQF